MLYINETIIVYCVPFYILKVRLANKCVFNMVIYRDDICSERENWWRFWNVSSKEERVKKNMTINLNCSVFIAKEGLNQSRLKYECLQSWCPRDEKFCSTKEHPCSWPLQKMKQTIIGKRENRIFSGAQAS